MNLEIVKKRFSIKLGLIFFILVYVGLVNAYNLFYIPEDGRLLELSVGSSNKRHVKYFEKVDVVKAEPQKTIIPPVEERQLPETTEPKSESEIYSTASNNEPLIENLQQEFRLNPPDFNPDLEIFGADVKQETPSLPQPKKEDKVTEPKVLPISKSEVNKLSYKLELDSLKDGAIIELHISESFSEIFTIFIQSGVLYVNEGVTSDKDLEIWIGKSGFEELLSTTDVSATAKMLVNEGTISVSQYSSTYALWRKGYKKFGENMGLI